MTKNEIAINQVTKVLAEGMYSGNMHLCLRSAGRLTGGFAANGHLSVDDIGYLKGIAVSRSNDAKLGARTFMQAVDDGAKMPLDTGYEEIDLSTARAFNWDEPLQLKRRKSDGEILGIGGLKTDYQHKEKFAKVIDETWIQKADIPPPPETHGWQAEHFLRYLSLIFNPQDKVGLNLTVWPQQTDNGIKWLPDVGVFDRTVQELTDLVRKKKGDLGAVLGDHNPDAGAWVRINALDGEGAKDVNVTNYRHALIECDGDAMGKQLQIIRDLQLPCSCIVHSGGKSIHALVQVSAKNLDEYKQRVVYLHGVVGANGLTPDPQCKNPSRLSRLPGFERKGKQQYIIDNRCGMTDWDSWVEWIEDKKDDLPDIENLGSCDFDNLPEKSEEVIGGILRMGHKLILSGPSKGGKSFDLIELCAAIASGSKWHDWPCKQGKVLYVNSELDRISAQHRVRDIFAENNIPFKMRNNIEFWNLKGKNKPLDKLAPKLIRRALQQRYTMIVFDPIYKILTGDENNAADMAEFMNLFDMISDQLGCSIACCHHHSKGAQGGKASADRSSGSGVFGRDPEAILDMVELNVSPDGRQQLIRVMSARALCEQATKKGVDLEQYSDDELENPDSLLLNLTTDYPGDNDFYCEVKAQAVESARKMTGWRIESTLREFEKPKNAIFWFRYPVHLTDDTGILTDAKAEGEEAPWKAAHEQKKKDKIAEKERKKLEKEEEATQKAKAQADAEQAEQDLLYTAIGNLGGLGVATKKGLELEMRLSEHRVRTLMNKHGIISRRGDNNQYALFGSLKGN